MFRLMEPSAGQFPNYVEGTFSRCAHLHLVTCFGSMSRNMLPDL